MVTFLWTYIMHIVNVEKRVLFLELFLPKAFTYILYWKPIENNKLISSEHEKNLIADAQLF